MISRLLREPLLHFLLLGLGLFALYSAVERRDAAPTDEIVVTRAQIESLSDGFTRTWRRPPTAAEIATLVDEHVIEEIYYREALALGLDRDDTVIRRRLRQKMEFISADAAPGRAADDATLQAYLEQNTAKFATPERTSFEQVFFSLERRGDAARADAERTLAELEAGATASEAGDATLLPASFDAQDASQIDRALGEDFARELAQAPLGRWSGPIPSAFGLHLVRVTRREPGALRPLREIQPQVAAEWQAEQRARANEDILARLRTRYTVRVEP